MNKPGLSYQAWCDYAGRSWPSKHGRGKKGRDTLLSAGACYGEETVRRRCDQFIEAVRRHGVDKQYVTGLVRFVQDYIPMPIDRWNHQMAIWVDRWSSPYVPDDKLAWNERMQDAFIKRGKAIRAWPDCALKLRFLTEANEAWANRHHRTLGLHLKQMHERTADLWDELHEGGGGDPSIRLCVHLQVVQEFKSIIDEARDRGAAIDS